MASWRGFTGKTSPVSSSATPGGVARSVALAFPGSARNRREKMAQHATPITGTTATMATMSKTNFHAPPEVSSEARDSSVEMPVGCGSWFVEGVFCVGFVVGVD